MVQSGLHSKASRVRLSFLYQRCRLALRDALPVWLALAAVTTAPYVVAALRTPSEHVFTGVLTAYDDTFSYLSWMKQSANGRWLMCDLYTSEPQACEFFLPLWVLLGKISRVTSAPLIWIFHGGRLLASLLLLIVARSVALRVMRSRRRLRFTLWMYAMSGGLGWLVFLISNGGNLLSASVTSGSADLNLPEAIAFRSAYAQVHFTLGAALVACAINLAFSVCLSGKANRAIVAGLLVSLLAVVHPYLVVVVSAVTAIALALWPLLNPQKGESTAFVTRAVLGFGLAALPGVAYLFWLNRSSEILREWLRVTDTLSPPPLEYALGFGIVTLLAMPGFALLFRKHAPDGRLLFVWALVQAALLYAPVSYQRRLVEGLQLPLCIASSVAVFWLTRRLRVDRRARSAFLIGIIVIASLTNFGFIAGQIFARGEASGASDSRRYVPADLASALEWLGANAEPDAVIFASYLTGNIAPSMTGLRVYLGHYGQTLQSDEKGEIVTALYRGDLSDEAACSIFEEQRVSYVIYSPFEHATSERFDPPPCVKLVRSFGEVRLFKVSVED